MLSLIIKDILIQKKIFVFALFYIVFFIFVFQSLGELMYIAANVAFAYLMVSGAFAYDDKSKSDIMLNSLPITRGKIVMAKYISLLVYMVIGTIAFTVFSYVISVMNLPLKTYPITIEGIVGTFFGVSLMNSIYFPLTFKLGYTKAKIANMLLFFTFFFGFPMLFSSNTSKINIPIPSGIISFLSNQPDSVIGLGIVGLTLIILFTSYFVSAKLYKQREF